MTDTTARLALPLLVPGQAQKELFHNEALLRLDLAVQASVEAVGLDAPPPAPVAGAAWVVGTSPAGAWAGQAGAIAGWTAGGWRFVAPHEGMAVWDRDSGMVTRYADGNWAVGTVTAASVTVAGLQVVGARRPAIPDPAGGTDADTEARAAIAAILGALRAHGLIAG